MFKTFKYIFLFMTLCSVSLLAKTNRMTILDFDNNSGIKKYNSLGKALSDMLTTDLTYVKGLKIVEREKLRDIMKEMKLSGSKYINKKTALKLGKGLSANWILKGHFTTMKGRMRIDVNILSTETGEVIESATVEGWTQKFFDLEKRLIRKIIKAIHTDEQKVVYVAAPEQKVKNFKTIVDYSKALKLYDEGKFKESRKVFAKIKAYDKNFKYSDKYLKELEKRLKQYIQIDQMRKRFQKNEKIKKFFENYDALKNNETQFYSSVIDIFSTLLSDNYYTDVLSLVALIKQKPPVVYTNPKYIKTFKMLVDYYELTALKWLKRDAEFLKKGEVFIQSYPNNNNQKDWIIEWMQDIIDFEKKLEKETKKYKKEKKKRLRKLKKDLKLKRVKSRIKYKKEAIARNKTYRQREIERENRNQNITAEKKALTKKKYEEELKKNKEELKELNKKLKNKPLELNIDADLDILYKAVRYHQYTEAESISNKLLKIKKQLTKENLFDTYENKIDNYINRGNFKQAKAFYSSIKKEMNIAKIEKKILNAKQYLEAKATLKATDFDDEIETIEDKLEEDDLDSKTKSKLRTKKYALKSQKSKLESFIKKQDKQLERVKKYIGRIHEAIKRMPK